MKRRGADELAPEAQSALGLTTAEAFAHGAGALRGLGSTVAEATAALERNLPGLRAAGTTLQPDA